MEHLPDDVLLTLMQYLDVPDLLACRLVCKRIGGLALHPHVWRRRRVYHTDRFRSPVLRLAPCLAYLRVELPADDQLLYSTTRCAVSTLSLTVHGGSAVYAALVIRNQETLGRLKSIDVWFWADKTGADAPALLWALAVTSGLDGIAVDVSGHHDYVISTTSLPTARPRSALTFFRCNLISVMGPFCDFLLAAHADTMEEVCFMGEWDSKALSSTASLLARMPNLRSLSDCPLLPGMDALAACESLEQVELHVESDMRDAVPQAEEFLRRSKKLRNVAIDYWGDACTNGVGVNLVLALVSSRPSLVESLNIRIHETGNSIYESELLQPLIRALPLMPALQELQLQTASEELLLAITPATNPVLRTIKLHPTELNTPWCAHGYLHWDPVETLLSIYPSLDLIVFASYYCVEGSQDCEPCDLGCHGDIWESEWRKECEIIKRINGDPCPYWITIPRLNQNPVPSDSTPLP